MAETGCWSDRFCFSIKTNDYLTHYCLHSACFPEASGDCPLRAVLARKWPSFEVRNMFWGFIYYSLRVALWPLKNRAIGLYVSLPLAAENRVGFQTFRTFSWIFFARCSGLNKCPLKKRLSHRSFPSCRHKVRFRAPWIAHDRLKCI